MEVDLWHASLSGFGKGQCSRSMSGKTREPKPELLGSGYPSGGGGGGQKSSVYVPRNQGNQTFFCGMSRNFAQDIPDVPGKFEKKKNCAQFSSPNMDLLEHSDLSNISIDSMWTCGLLVVHHICSYLFIQAPTPSHSQKRAFETNYL